MSAEDAAAAAGSPGSARRAELLALAYEYVLERGLAGLALRPLAAATGTSPRVLLYLFGSKEGLVRELLARAREDQLTLVRNDLDNAEMHDIGDVTEAVWRVLAAPERRGLVRLVYEAFIMSVQPDPGPWEGFATEQISDWLALLRSAQREANSRQAEIRATRELAVIRGLLLDLLATGDNDRVTRALGQQRAPGRPGK
ncbi:MAG TPA: TetR/AcrR family transcriptional regulator [Trebonia sp.]|nr:TetR/AcrR family transcriptional regulator [Trebonia sp.]